MASNHRALAALAAGATLAIASFAQAAVTGPTAPQAARLSRTLHLGIVGQRGEVLAEYVFRGKPTHTKPVPIRWLLANPHHYVVVRIGTWDLVYGMIKTPAIRIVVDSRAAITNPFPQLPDTTSKAPTWALWFSFTQAKAGKPVVRVLERHNTTI
jgi:hypothetical protein